MKRNEMLVKMQRVYAIRHVMVESGHLTLKDFMSELLQVQENEGMLPPTTQLSHIDAKDNAWDPEDVSK